MSDSVRRHYESHPYPVYPFFASVRHCDTYALNLSALWAHFNGELPTPEASRILIAGCGSFSPYPYAIANKTVPITALDLSEASLKRARTHCLLHGIRNVTFCRGDMLDKSAAAEKFGLIDSYGVLHHLEDPQQGLNALTARLAEGGIIRVMVYSRYARKEEDSIRRAFRLLGIRDTATARRLIKQAKPGSRLYSFAKSSYEAQSNSGLADALLHPSVKSYRIDEFVKLVHGSGLQLLRFAHDQALEDRNAEIARIRRMESDRQSPGNFVAFLGQNTNRAYPSKSNAVLQLNPCLIGSISRPRVSGLTIPPRLGMDNPPLDSSARRFLKRFISPVRIDQLTPEDYIRTAVYRKALFLLQYNP